MKKAWKSSEDSIRWDRKVTTNSWRNMMTNTEFILKIITISFYFGQVASSDKDKP
jgi:hypothetical protein